MSIPLFPHRKTNVLPQDKQREGRMRGKKEGGEVKREADN